MKILKFILIYILIINFNCIVKLLAKERSKFYVVSDVGVIVDDSELGQSIYDKIKDFEPRGLDIKNNIGLTSEWGLGYRINHKMRFDIKIGLDKSDHIDLRDKVDDIYPAGLSEEIKKFVKGTDYVYRKDIKIKARNFGLDMNYCYDLHEVIYSKLRPFMMVGVGILKQEIATRIIALDYKFKYKKKNTRDSEYKSIKHDRNSTIYNRSYDTINPFYILGLGISLTNENTPNYNIDFAYKLKNNLRNTFKVGVGNEVRIKAKAHNFTLRVRYNF